MLPIALELSKLRIALVGSAEAVARRRAQLAEAGANEVTVVEVTSNSVLSEELITHAQILLVAGLDEKTSAQLADLAHAHKMLVWVEDKPALCDFYFTGVVRRGDLTIAVSTSGKSPTLARKLREELDGLYGAEWEFITQELAEQRALWKKAGYNATEINKRAEAMIEERGWLKRKQVA